MKTGEGSLKMRCAPCNLPNQVYQFLIPNVYEKNNN
jgi:hypothetical protein